MTHDATKQRDAKVNSTNTSKAINDANKQEDANTIMVYKVGQSSMHLPTVACLFATLTYSCSAVKNVLIVRIDFVDSDSEDAFIARFTHLESIISSLFLLIETP